MKKSTKLIGLLSAGFGILYVYKASEEKALDGKGLEGFNIDINADKVIDTAKNFVRANPVVKEAGAEAAKRLVGHILSRRGKTYE